MPPNTTLSIEDATAILESFSVSAEDQALLIKAMRMTPPETLLRGSALFGVRDAVHTSDEEGLARFQELWERFAPASVFSQIPIHHVWVLMCCAAALSFPSTPLREAMSELVIGLGRRHRDHPLVAIFRRAASSFEEFLPMQTRALIDGQPLCEGDFHWLGSRHAEIVIDVPGAEFLSISLAAAFRALFAMHDIDGAVEIEELTETRMVLDLSW